VAAPLLVFLSDEPRSVQAARERKRRLAMTEFSLGAPHNDELGDAIEALEDVLRLDTTGEVDLPPYLTRLLLQLEETLSVAPAQSPVSA
jgi:hypothetical protein